MDRLLQVVPPKLGCWRSDLAALGAGVVGPMEARSTEDMTQGGTCSHLISLNEALPGQATGVSRQITGGPIPREAFRHQWAKIEETVPI